MVDSDARNSNPSKTLPQYVAALAGKTHRAIVQLEKIYWQCDIKEIRLPRGLDMKCLLIQVRLFHYAQRRNRTIAQLVSNISVIEFIHLQLLSSIPYISRSIVLITVSFHFLIVLFTHICFEPNSNWWCICSWCNARLVITNQRFPSQQYQSRI